MAVRLTTSTSRAVAWRVDHVAIRWTTGDASRALRHRAQADRTIRTYSNRQFSEWREFSSRGRPGTPVKRRVHIGFTAPDAASKAIDFLADRAPRPATPRRPSRARAALQRRLIRSLRSILPPTATAPRRPPQGGGRASGVDHRCDPGARRRRVAKRFTEGRSRDRRAACKRRQKRHERVAGRGK